MSAQDTHSPLPAFGRKGRVLAPLRREIDPPLSGFDRIVGHLAADVEKPVVAA